MRSSPPTRWPEAPPVEARETYHAAGRHAVSLLGAVLLLLLFALYLWVHWVR